MADEIPESPLNPEPAADQATDSNNPQPVASLPAACSPEPDDSLITCTCGVELPLNAEALAAGRMFSRYSVNRPFNRVFYQLLLGIGIHCDEARKDIYLLSAHKKHMKLAPIQVRIAYGVYRGVCSAKTGLLSKRRIENVPVDDSGVALDLQVGDSRLLAGFTKEDWPILEAEALTVALELPEAATTSKEFSWIRAKLYQWPEFKDAPSQGAIGTWLAISRPGNESLLRDFVKLDWSKRLSPGERVGKDRDPLRMDQGADDKHSTEHDAELNARLFGVNE